ncbi:unnamed protein product [Soboliphyme baturini]|uniref:AAA domain-containing protein n=1 Tax=Soboliphyme baturini TaxID=241478 RepID=A0A183IC02_9BILA|nr:unnamed protein product [Soboliphyme baturini]
MMMFFSRPRTVDEISFQTEVVSVLKKFVTSTDLPNMLFYGPPGTGKTSAILAMVKEIFGLDMYRERVLELNASDDRGIQVVREKVKQFSQFTASDRRPGGKKCPPLKIVILDEADSMTSAAQHALRRTMESDSRTTRFCIICNYISRIIGPIASRCAKFCFKPLSDESQKERLLQICQAEGVTVDEDAIDLLIKVCEGDLRRAINCLQSAARFKGEETITEEDIVELTAIIPDDVIDEFISACRGGSHQRVEEVIRSLYKNGYSAYQAMIQLHQRIISDTNMSDLLKAKVLDKIAVCEKRLLDGSNELLQLMDIACVYMLSSIQ